MALESLKVQHGTLMKSLQTLDTSLTLSAHRSAQASPLPGTAEEEERLDNSSAFTRRSKRNSIATTITDSINEWFDASEGEGVQEFILDDHLLPEGASRIVTSESRSSLDHSEASSIDTDIDSVNETPPVISSSPDVENTSQAQIVRRTRLPVPVVGDEGSLFTVLKKNVGKVRASISVHHLPSLIWKTGSFYNRIPSDLQRTSHSSTTSSRGDGVL